MCERDHGLPSYVPRSIEMFVLRVDPRSYRVGDPSRPIGSWAITLCCPSVVPPVKRSISGVAMMPGHTALLVRQNAVEERGCRPRGVR